MYLSQFFTYLQHQKRYSRHTLQAYKADISQFSQFILAQFNFTDNDLLSVNHKMIRAWVVQLMDSKMKAKSVNRKLSTLKTYFKYLLKNEIILKNPMIKVVSPKIEKSLPLFIEQNAIDEIFKYIDENYLIKSNEDNFIICRDKLIIELLYGTGIRRAELLGLSDTSFDFSNKTIKVLGKGNKERLIPISKKLIIAIQEYIAIRNQVFGTTDTLLLTNNGKKAYERLIYNLVHTLLNTVTTIQRKSPHILRHTFATHLSNNGAELNAIKELLGHASLASTQVYTHNTIDKLKEVHRRAHPKA